MTHKNYKFIQGVGILEISDINQGGGIDFLEPIYFSYMGNHSFFSILLFRQGFYFSDANFFQLNSL